MDDFTPEELEQARILFARPATFVMGCAKIEQLPDPDLPEIAFAGRSNVGKSSLINGLVGMHKLARASNPAAYPAVIVTSAEKGDGLPELRAEIMRTTGVTL